MNRYALWIAGIVASSSCLFAQSAKSSMLRPNTGPTRNAGVYHVGLGTWTRHFQTDAGLAGLDVIYSNTCPTGYHAALLTNEYVGDEGRVPGPNGPVLCSTNLLSTNAGCHCQYLVSAFDIGYCADTQSSQSFKIGFQSAYTACAVPAATTTITASGLPGAGTHPEICWVVTVDLASSGQEFRITADGASCTWAPSDLATAHLFGWTFENLNAGAAGPMMAGSGGHGGGCSMVDGTRWDTLTCTGQGGFPAKWPNNGSEDGFGMDTQDRFRDDSSTGGAVTPPNGPGCYFFGGNPGASFHLKLYADSGCNTCNGCSATDVCVPGVGGTLACPCSNPQVPTGSTRGCDNSASTGGAILTSSGTASLTGDSLHFASTFETGAALSVLLQGQLPLGSGVAYGQGVLCVSNGLVRLYVHNAVAGTTAYPQGAEISVHLQSQTKGDTISAGATRLYAAYYRDPIVLGACAASATYNITQTQSLVWAP